MARSAGGPASRWMACGYLRSWPGSEPSGGSAGFGPTGPRSLRSSPEGGRLVSSPTLGRGTSLHGIQASQPFPLVRVIKVRRQRLGRLLVLTARGSGRSEAGQVFDSQRGGGYSPLGSPSPAVCAGLSWGQSDTGGGVVYVKPRSRWSTRPGDGSDTQGEIAGRPGGATRAGTMSIGK